MRRVACQSPALCHDCPPFGVGCDANYAELLEKKKAGALVVWLTVKLVIWSGRVGRGTSDGILTPNLKVGVDIGAVARHLVAGVTPRVWALVGLLGALAGVTRLPLTAIVVALELTYDPPILLALLVTATLANLMSVLIVKRSILTENVAGRGFHVMREHSLDPLETVSSREVMDAEFFCVEPESRVCDAHGALSVD